MAFFKVVFTYTQTDLGFSEVFYREDTSLEAAASFSDSLLQALVRPRTSLTVLRKARVSSVDNNRNSLVVNINRSSGTSNNDPDVCSTAAVVTINSSAIGARRQVWMRGLPDSYVARVRTTGVDDPAPQFLIFLQNYLQALQDRNFCVRALKKLGTEPLIYTPIRSVEVIGPGVVKLTFTVPITITASRRIIISQLDQKQFGGLEGTFTATSITSSTVNVAYNSPLTPGVYEVSKGRSRPAEFEYGVINAGLSAFLKFGSRDTGKNPLGGRGRRSRHLTRLG